MSDGGTTAVKAARNQSLWREVNERVASVAEAAGEMELLCECADIECTQTITISAGEYEHVRGNPTHFPIAVGHDYPDVEKVVEENERYAVVEKTGEAGEVANHFDPRSRERS